MNILQSTRTKLDALSERAGLPPGVVYIGIFFIILVIITILLLGVGNNQPRQADEYTEFDGPAVIVGGEELFADIGEASFNSLKDDVNAFARQKIPVYQETSNQVVFEIDTYSKDDVVRIVGTYGEYNETVEITLQQRNYGVVETTFTVGELSSDDITLPSSSVENDYIGSLPTDEGDFTVDYLPDSNSFYVVLKQPVTANSAAKIRSYFQEKLETKNISDYNFSVVGYDSSGNFKSVRIVNPATE